MTTRASGRTRSVQLLWLPCLLLAFGIPAAILAADGDTHLLVSHPGVVVVTDPSKGTNSYPRWTVFPPEDVEYRKVTLWITYACPDSLHCGEWDYIDQVTLRRAGSEAEEEGNVELARMISPYGWRFGSDWTFRWHVDVTDFSLLLHDSVEIAFVHTGYESNTDRGWKISVEFEITEGRPPMKCLGFDTLWCGSFPYGDTARPIEALLHPVAFQGPAGAEIARLRIQQTGHGMDDSSGCAEFCTKFRRVVFDDSLVSQRELWRKCGDNPLYPQGGTWIFDRANWCPGAVVHPDQYDLPIGGGRAHTIDLDMEPYTGPDPPSAHWQIASYLSYCEAPWATHDVSVDEILVPSASDEYSRMNPACGQPTFLMTNRGRESVTSVQVRYGLDGQKESAYRWTGDLLPQASVEVVLPGDLAAGEQQQPFHVRLEFPNEQKDDYPADNAAYSQSAVVPRYPTELVLAFRTNRDSGETSYRVTDLLGHVVRERTADSLAAHTIYYDTLLLEPGCYRLTVADTAGNGLNFWYNAEGGYGYLRLLGADGTLIKSFGSDFGSSIDHWFEAAPGATASSPDSLLPVVEPFPPRNEGTWDVDIFFNEPTSALLRVVTEDSSRVVFNQELTAFKEGSVPVDISAEPDGVYWLRLETGEKTVTRRIRVKR